MNNKQPIGVFDSGMGGLTVLQALKKQLPQESFIFLGDTARLPYGTKSLATVQQYALQMTRVLIERQIKALVIACNTATTAALSHLQTMLPHMPVIGVVNPGTRAVIAVTQNHRIAVFATETTISSQAYQSLIRHYLPSAAISVQACNLLVTLAEEGMINNRIAREAMLHYLSDLKDEDTILLGCTHFPVFRPLLCELLPMHIKIVDSAQATAQTLEAELKSKNIANLDSSTKPETQYLVTDSIARFQRVGEIFLGQPLDHQAIEIINAC